MIPVFSSELIVSLFHRSPFRTPVHTAHPAIVWPCFVCLQHHFRPEPISVKSLFQPQPVMFVCLWEFWSVSAVPNSGPAFSIEYDPIPQSTLQWRTSVYFTGFCFHCVSLQVNSHDCELLIVSFQGLRFGQRVLYLVITDQRKNYLLQLTEIKDLIGNVFKVIVIMKHLKILFKTSNSS